MSLGSLIAKARKDAGLSLEDLAAKTNIRISVLSEIEKDNFAQCGGETYARGHVRNIASILKADQKEFIRLYDEEQGGEVRSMKDLLVENNVMRQPEDARKISWKVLVMISIVSLFVVGIAQVIISNTASTDEVSAKPSASAAPSSTETQSESPEAEPSAQSTFSTGTGVEVVVDATRAKSWLFVSDAAGRTLFSGQIPRGGAKTFSSDSQLNLKVGNAGGVDLKVNGKKVPSLGVDGEVVSVSYGVDS
jgi:cytoskeletal protein RodZ